MNAWFFHVSAWLYCRVHRVKLECGFLLHELDAVRKSICVFVGISLHAWAGMPSFRQERQTVPTDVWQPAATKIAKVAIDTLPCLFKRVSVRRHKYITGNTVTGWQLWLMRTSCGWSESIRYCYVLIHQVIAQYLSWTMEEGGMSQCKLETLWPP